jgi:hypothetical protein
MQQGITVTKICRSGLAQRRFLYLQNGRLCMPRKWTMGIRMLAVKTILAVQEHESKRCKQSGFCLKIIHEQGTLKLILPTVVERDGFVRHLADLVAQDCMMAPKVMQQILCTFDALPVVPSTAPAKMLPLEYLQSRG